MAARTQKGIGTLPAAWKEKIRVTQIINALNNCLEGKIQLTSQQIKAADILLKKVIPDLARQEMTGKDGEKLSLSVYTGVPVSDTRSN